MAMRCRLWECGLCCARPAPSRRPDTRSFAVGAEALPAPAPALYLSIKMDVLKGEEGKRVAKRHARR